MRSKAGGGYGRLVRGHAAPLGFGLLHAFLSSPGQTFFIALFVGSIATSLEVGEAALGTIYMAATLGAALVLPWAGPWIDRVDLRFFTGVATAALGAACLLVASAESMIGLALAIMLLRLTGQGAMVHIEATATARYFGADRGKALGLTALGLPLGEAVMPPIGAALIAALGWRDAYSIIGMTIIFAMLPLSQLLIAGRPDYVAPPSRAAGAPRPRITAGMLALARSEVFWLALPILVYMPFTATAVLFHIGTITAGKGWSLGLVAQAFVAFAACHAAALFLSGPLVDRLSGRQLLPLLPWPMLLGMTGLALSDHWLALVGFLGSVGASAGMAKTATSAMWAEMFGPGLVGSVRSAATTLMVAGTAAGPAAVGAAMGEGLSGPGVLMLLVAVGAGATVPLAVGWLVPQRRGGTG